MSPEDRSALVNDIVLALRSDAPCLTADEQTWVRAAIEAQAEARAVRQAVITKTLGGLVWAGVVGAGYVVLDFMRGHGFK